MINVIGLGYIGLPTALTGVKPAHARESSCEHDSPLA